MLSKQEIQNIRKKIPILKRYVYGKPLIYLDNAATTQKPLQVITNIVKYYKQLNSNVHRSNHFIGVTATEKVEKTRIYIQKFINASSPKEIIFTKGTTEAINLISYSIRNKLQAKDEIIISELEHHSNIIPWHFICKQIGCNIKILPINKYGILKYNKLRSLITNKTKIISICHISNVLGTINKIQHIIKYAHKHNILVIIDGAQSPGHIKIDVQELDADFYTFSGHKMFGPTGIGVLYGKYKILKELAPFQGGGEMVNNVSMYESSYQKPPLKFEAGTPNIAGIIGLKSSIDFIKSIKIENIVEYEHYITKYALEQLSGIKNIRIYGHYKTTESSIISFNIKNYAPIDIAYYLDRQGIAIRTGHQCAQPLMYKLKLNQGTIRISFAIYNTIKEIDYFISELKNVIKILNYNTQ
jgi:cysteine desulfurase/selenocysteine lyase